MTQATAVLETDDWGKTEDLIARLRERKTGSPQSLLYMRQAAQALQDLKAENVNLAEHLDRVVSVAADAVARAERAEAASNMWRDEVQFMQNGGALDPST